MSLIIDFNIPVTPPPNLVNEADKQEAEKFFAQSFDDNLKEQPNIPLNSIDSNKALEQREALVEKIEPNVAPTLDGAVERGDSGFENDIMQDLHESLGAERDEQAEDKEQNQKIIKHKEPEKVRFGPVLEPENEKHKVERNELRGKLSPEELDILESNERFADWYKRMFSIRLSGRKTNIPYEVAAMLNVAKKETKNLVEKDAQFMQKLENYADKYIKEQNTKLVNSITEWVCEIYGSTENFLQQKDKAVGDMKTAIADFECIKKCEGRSSTLVPFSVENRLFNFLFPRPKFYQKKTKMEKDKVTEVPNKRSKHQDTQLPKNTQSKRKRLTMLPPKRH